MPETGETPHDKARDDGDGDGDGDGDDDGDGDGDAHSRKAIRMPNFHA